MVEHHRAGTSIRTALAAAEALDVSMDYLVGLVDDPTPTRKLLSDVQAKTALLLDLGVTEQFFTRRCRTRAWMKLGYFVARDAGTEVGPALVRQSP